MKLEKFTYDKPIQYTRRGNIATLTRKVKIKLYTDEGTYLLTVDKGFRWNGNSGSFPCRFHDTNIEYNTIILVHDALYHRIGLSKADADNILCGGLKQAGYGVIMRELIHFAVNTFARCAYNSDDEMTIENLDYLDLQNISSKENKRK